MIDIGATTARQLSSTDVAVVREVYDSDNSEDMFRMELERALEVGCRTIIIEPSRLAMETRRWIVAGEYIRTTSAVAGCATFVIDFVVAVHPMYLVFPLGLASSFCLALHSISWSPDPCSAYAVERRRQKLTPSARVAREFSSASGESGEPLKNKTATTAAGPVVLAKREGVKGRKSPVLTVIAVSALAYALWRIRSVST